MKAKLKIKKEQIKQISVSKHLRLQELITTIRYSGYRHMPFHETCPEIITGEGEAVLNENITYLDGCNESQPEKIIDHIS